MSTNLGTQSEGYFTRGMKFVGGDSLSAASGIPVDAALPNGQSPQSAAIIPGTQCAPSTQIGLTALAGGGKAGATQLGYGVNELSTVATGADSALMPFAFPGALVFVRNDGANSATIFGKGTDTIDGVATGTGNAQAAAKGKLYLGISGNGDGANAGAWVTLLGA